MDRKYGRSILEKIEECVQNWLDFKESDFETEDELLFAMEEVGNRKNELKMSDAEWFSIWMLETVKKRKTVEMFQYQSLWNVVKLGGAEVIKNFGDKFKELKIEGVRTKVVDTLYMGSESEARKRYQNRGNFLRDRGRSFSRSRYGQND